MRRALAFLHGFRLLDFGGEAHRVVRGVHFDVVVEVDIDVAPLGAARRRRRELRAPAACGRRATRECARPTARAPHPCSRSRRASRRRAGERRRSPLVTSSRNGQRPAVSATTSATSCSRSRSMSFGCREARMAHLERVAQLAILARRADRRAPATRSSCRRASFAASFVVRGSSSRNVQPLRRTSASAAAARAAGRACARAPARRTRRSSRAPSRRRAAAACA